jgi:hypothetical protein
MPTTPLMDSVISSLNTVISKESDIITKNVQLIDNTINNNTITEIENNLTSLYLSLERDCAQIKIQEYVDQFIKIVKTMPDIAKSEYCTYIIMLVFNTRDINGGKGERKIARELFLCLYKYFPKTIEMLVPKFPEYGYWRDLCEMLLDINTDLKTFAELKTVILNTFIEQLQIDWDNYEQWENDRFAALSSGQEFSRVLSLSMLPKWIPKENGRYDKKIKVAKDLAKLLYPNEFKTKFSIAMAKYRIMIVKLNAAINTTEILMCQKKFSQIQFKLVPGKCLHKYKCAFLNIKPNLTLPEQPRNTEQDRIKCRENLLQFISEVKTGKHSISPSQIFIDEIVEKLLPNNINKLTNEEIELLELYWKSIYEDYKKLVDNNQINLSKGVILSDMSGSMNGKPMAVSISCAIFISSLLKEPFRNRFISFDTNPTWNIINESTHLVDKINMIMKTSWRGSTDLERAYNLILDKAVLNKLDPIDMPDWFLITTDMPFHKANRNDEWSNILENLEQRFMQIGLNTIGKPYKLPEMIYWNVRGDSAGFPVYSYNSNSLLISGFNICILKDLLKTQNLSKITPWMNIKCILDNERYKPILEIIKNVSEAPYFRQYAITSDIEVLTETPSPITSDKKTKNGFLSYLTSYF